jgi:hypothetical protein
MSENITVIYSLETQSPRYNAVAQDCWSDVAILDALLRIVPFRTADNTPFKLHRQIVLSPFTRRRR